MGNGISSDSSSGWELEGETEKRPPPLCNTFDGYLLLPLEVRVKILSQIRKFRTKMSLLWADRSLYEYCCRHDVLTVQSLLVSTKEKDSATVKVSFYENHTANLYGSCFGAESDFDEMHKFPKPADGLPVRGRTRHKVPVPEYCRHKKEIEKRQNKKKLSIQHDVNTQPVEGMVSYKPKQLVFNGSFLRSVYAVYDLGTLVLDAPCVPPPSGPPLKCYEVQMHWDFGYLRKLNREVDTEGLFIKWIEHAQPKGLLRIFLYSKIAKEELIALCSRNWGDVRLVVNWKHLRMPVSHVGAVIAAIPLETRDFGLSVRDCLTCDVDVSIELQLTRRIQHFINMNGDYNARVYIGADSFDIDVYKVRQRLVIPSCPEFCIAEDYGMEFELRLRHNKSGRYISLEFERNSRDDPCAICLHVHTCKCDPKVEHVNCEHGFRWCGSEW